MVDQSKYGLPIPDPFVDSIKLGLQNVIGPWRQNNQVTRPPVFYHYTTPGGFHGIIDSGVLRATHIAYMNDVTEYLHAVSMTIAAAIELLKEARTELEKSVLSVCVNELKAIDHTNVPPMFVACFSERKNSLGQWRAYGQGEGGLCIGFDSGGIDRAASELEIGGVYPVEYNRERQRQLCLAMLHWALFEWKRIQELVDPKERSVDLSAWVRTFLLAISPIAPLLKNDAFEEEREWRIVVVGAHPDIWIAPTGKGLTQYLELKPHVTAAEPAPGQRLLPISEVWIGPGSSGHLTQMAAKILLERKSYFGVTLHQAWIPYRQK